MSKRELTRYLEDLDKEQLQEQLIALYNKFKPVKVYYDFVFNPKEEELLKEAKIKISNEYFPIQNGAKPKRPKIRRSVSTGIVKHFILLGVDPFKIADLMLFSIEIAQTFSVEREIKSQIFYVQIYTSFQQLIKFLQEHGIFSDYKYRIQEVGREVTAQKCPNNENFTAILQQIDDDSKFSTLNIL